MHPVIEFYLGLRKTEHNFTLEQLWELKPAAIGDAYFYIPWLFPVDDFFYWRKPSLLLKPEDVEQFKNNPEIQQKFLKSFDVIMDYFGIYRVNNDLFVKEEIANRHYWLRNIGHETKKIARVIKSLYVCGQPELAKKLQQLAIPLGKEKGHLLPETIETWQNLIP